MIYVERAAADTWTQPRRTMAPPQSQVSRLGRLGAPSGHKIIFSLSITAAFSSFVELELLQVAANDVTCSIWCGSEWCFGRAAATTSHLQTALFTYLATQ